MIKVTVVSIRFVRMGLPMLLINRVAHRRVDLGRDYVGLVCGIRPDFDGNALVHHLLEAQIVAEKLENVILKAIRDGAGVGTRIDFEAVRDSVLVENIVQFASVRS